MRKAKRLLNDFAERYSIDRSLLDDEKFPALQRAIDDPEIAWMKLRVLPSSGARTTAEEELDLIGAIAGLDLAENSLRTHYSQYREFIMLRETMRAQGLGSMHPEVLAIEEKTNQSLQRCRGSLRNVEKKWRNERQQEFDEVKGKYEEALLKYQKAE